MTTNAGIPRTITRAETQMSRARLAKLQKSGRAEETDVTTGGPADLHIVSGKRMAMKRIDDYALKRSRHGRGKRLRHAVSHQRENRMCNAQMQVFNVLHIIGRHDETMVAQACHPAAMEAR